jgi:hypothetical protein
MEVGQFFCRMLGVRAILNGGAINVIQLAILFYVAQQQTATAHVAPADKFGGNDEPAAKYWTQYFQVFPASKAAQKNHFTIGTYSTGKLFGGAPKRRTVDLVRNVDRHAAESPQICESNQSVVRHEAGGGSDNENARAVRRRARNACA